MADEARSWRTTQVTIVAAMVIAVMASGGLAACSLATTSSPTAASPLVLATLAPRPSLESAGPSSTPRRPSATQDAERLTEPFPYGAFSDSTTIEHEYSPLVPGTQWVWEGFAGVGDDRRPHRVVTTVTSLTKVIDGVRAIVTHEEDYDDGELVEAEIAFFAQDDTGTIWHLGQYPEEYRDGVLVEAPTWIAGFEDAKAGIAIKGTPAFSAFSYSQGWGPAVGWTDRARVFEMASRTCVPAGCYHDVLVTDEFNPDEPDAHQLKYYAPGVGLVRVGWAGALEATQEVLELVKVVTLTPEQLAADEARVLALEAHGYQVSQYVYAKTPPMERP